MAYPQASERDRVGCCRFGDSLPRLHDSAQHAGFGTGLRADITAVPVTRKVVIAVNPDGAIADRKAVSEKIPRTDERSLCADLVKVIWTDESGSKRKELAALEDISTGGACVQVERPIPVGTPISVLYPDGRYHGRVRYCIFQHTGHFVGIEFDPGYQWSKQEYMPSHLLELKSMRAKNKQ